MSWDLRCVLGWDLRCEMGTGRAGVSALYCGAGHGPPVPSTGGTRSLQLPWHHPALGGHFRIPLAGQSPEFPAEPLKPLWGLKSAFPKQRPRCQREIWGRYGVTPVSPQSFEVIMESLDFLVSPQSFGVIMEPLDIPVSLPGAVPAGTEQPWPGAWGWLGIAAAPYLIINN